MFVVGRVSLQADQEGVRDSLKPSQVAGGGQGMQGGHSVFCEVVVRKGSG